MPTETINVSTAQHDYQILIGEDIFADLIDWLSLNHPLSRLAVICDHNVAQHHLQKLENLLHCYNISFCSVIAGAGEKAKSFANVMMLSETLLAYGLERGDLIICLGGGVIGDLGGFCSAILLRGIGYIQLPTSLLAQVDAAIGGKTGINTSNGKNLIGAFHQPLRVCSDISVLATLPQRQFLSGYAEIVKYGLIASKDFFEYLEKNVSQISARKTDVLHYMIMQSCRLKSSLVSQDTHEHGVRALLNFGHSFGHALEALIGYCDDILLHGEAVALGCCVAMRYSQRLRFCDAMEVSRLQAHFNRLGFNTKLSELCSHHSITAAQIMEFLRRDKKNRGGKIRLVLANYIGKAFVYDKVDERDLMEFLQQQLTLT